MVTFGDTRPQLALQRLAQFNGVRVALIADDYIILDFETTHNAANENGFITILTPLIHPSNRRNKTWALCVKEQLLRYIHSRQILTNPTATARGILNRAYAEYIRSRRQPIAARNIQRMFRGRLGRNRVERLRHQMIYYGHMGRQINRQWLNRGGNHGWEMWMNNRFL